MDKTGFFDKYHYSVIADAGAYPSDEFKKFARDMKAAMKKSATEKGYTLLSFNRGHYSVFGFFEKDGKYVYFSFDCPRYGLPVNLSASDAMNGFLYRTAASAKDYTGGSNNFTNWNRLFDSVSRLFELELRKDGNVA